MGELHKSKLLGQVFTPSSIAREMAELIVSSNRFDDMKILDPCVGPATFLNAFNTINLKTNIQYFGLDIDEEMIDRTKTAARQITFSSHISQGDYLLEPSSSITPNAIIMNPPYVRHEWIPIALKKRYKELIKELYGVSIDGRSNLFIYFLLKSFNELVENGVMCIIVYDALTSSSYGKKAMELILSSAEIEYQHHVKTPFNEALVDATIMLIRKKKKGISSQEYKNNVSVHENLVPLKELANSRRGTGLLSSKLFIADPKEPHYNEAKLFLKKQPLETLQVGYHNIKQKAYLYETEEQVPKGVKLWLDTEASKLCKAGRNSKTLENKMRINDKWVLHKLHAAPILFNYYIRSNPRFLLNQDSIPYSDNFYGIDPIDFDNEAAWVLLNTPTYLEHLLLNARNQGNGLKKIQLYEFNDAYIPDWRLLDQKEQIALKKIAKELLSGKNFTKLIGQANQIAENILKG